VIIDPLFKFIRAKDSNDYAETSALLERLDHFSRERDLTIVCAHHQKKRETEDVGDGALGSTAIRAGSNTNIFLKQDRSGFRSIQTEQKYGVGLEPTLLRFDSEIARFYLDASVSAVQQNMEESQRQRLNGEIVRYVAAHPGVTQPEVLSGVGGRTQALTDTLRRLTNDGLLKRLGKGGKNDAFRYELGDMPSEAHSVLTTSTLQQPKEIAA
jgi:hypothetical protein